MCTGAGAGLTALNLAAYLALNEPLQVGFVNCRALGRENLGKYLGEEGGGLSFEALAAETYRGDGPVTQTSLGGTRVQPGGLHTFLKPAQVLDLVTAPYEQVITELSASCDVLFLAAPAALAGAELEARSPHEQALAALALRSADVIVVGVHAGELITSRAHLEALSMLGLAPLDHMSVPGMPTPVRAGVVAHRDEFLPAGGIEAVGHLGWPVSAVWPQPAEGSVDELAATSSDEELTTPLLRILEDTLQRSIQRQQQRAGWLRRLSRT